MTPSAIPFAPIVTSRTRHDVLSRTPRRSASGQYVMSVLDFAPCAQPAMHVPALMHGARPSYASLMIALSDGHQCQPRRLNPRAMVSPSFPSGSGGSGGIFGGSAGYAGSPARPETPIMRSLTSYQGASVR